MMQFLPSYFVHQHHHFVFHSFDFVIRIEWKISLIVVCFLIFCFSLFVRAKFYRKKLDRRRKKNTYIFSGVVCWVCVCVFQSRIVYMPVCQFCFYFLPLVLSFPVCKYTWWPISILCCAATVATVAIFTAATAALRFWWLLTGFICVFINTLVSIFSRFYCDFGDWTFFDFALLNLLWVDITFGVFFVLFSLSFHVC